MARAFNDHLADFAAVDPKRLVVSYQLPIIDIDHAVDEVERLAALGARSIQLPNYPSELGFADYHDARYDPLWSALEETSIIVSQHLGPKDSLWDVYRRDPLPQKAIFTSLPAMALAENMAWWILTGILERHPGSSGRLRRTWVWAGCPSTSTSSIAGYVPMPCRRSPNSRACTSAGT